MERQRAGKAPYNDVSGTNARANSRHGSTPLSGMAKNYPLSICPHSDETIACRKGLDHTSDSYIQGLDHFGKSFKKASFRWTKEFLPSSEIFKVFL